MPEYPPEVAPSTATPAEPQPNAKAAVATPAPDRRIGARQAKSCCKGLNECKGKGMCKTDRHACKGMNQCKAMGGCKPPVCP